MSDITVDKGLLHLLDSGAHVWYCRTDEEVITGQLDVIEALLSEEELSRYRAIKHPKSQRSYLVAHAMLRAVLSKYINLPAVDWRFVRGKHGKPSLHIVDDVPDIRFNITHTDGLCACVLTLGKECGIDVERYDSIRKIEAISHRMFAEEETDMLAARGYDPIMFCRYWTLREAYVKALGAGLGGSSKAFCFEFDADSGKATIRHDSEPAEKDRWQMKLFEPIPGFQLAVVVEAMQDIEERLLEFGFI